MKKKKIGKILWHDLTVNDAEKVSDFYKEVIGWDKEEQRILMRVSKSAKNLEVGY